MVTFVDTWRGQGQENGVSVQVRTTVEQCKNENVLEKVTVLLYELYTASDTMGWPLPVSLLMWTTEKYCFLPASYTNDPLSLQRQAGDTTRERHQERVDQMCKPQRWYDEWRHLCDTGPVGRFCMKSNDRDYIGQHEHSMQSHEMIHVAQCE